MTPTWGGHSMTAPLRRVLVCRPEVAGWLDLGGAGWRGLGYRHPPIGDLAETQHLTLRRALGAAGVELIELPRSPGLTLDAVYAHDCSLPTDGGMVLLRPGKLARAAEPAAHAAVCGALGIPILGVIEPPGTAEAGDLVWLDQGTLLAGRGYRTNPAGITQLRALLAPLGVKVLEAPLPHGDGPAVCLHLMSLLSLLDERSVLVDPPWLVVETLEELERRGHHLVPIEPAERATQAANVLALGERKLLALAENPRTNARLRERGFEVVEIDGSELAQNGAGGPTCLTRSLWRTVDPRRA